VQLSSEYQIRKDYVKRSVPHLVCPQCLSNLNVDQKFLYCPNCNIKYPYDSDGRLNLTLQCKKKIEINFELNPVCYRESHYPRMPHYNNIDLKNRRDLPKMTKLFLGSMPRAANKNALCLDIGCGVLSKQPYSKQPYIEIAGYEYFGFDCEPEAPIVSDAHAIPFQSNHFDLATGHVVMEHFRYPWIVIKEIYRILKPGGYFHGRVAFFEGFHDSYYHMTHWAIGSLLESAGFDIEWL